MASTWSSLKIQLMGAGDEGGTWGTVTNANLGTVIEEAITGSSNVSFTSADVTLTLTDSTASQTARNLRLNLTGTSGGARNLIVPAIEKVYIVNNGLADTVTVKNSTGTGIAVPAGKTMYVFNNGTNVVDAITHLTSLTLETPLAVAQGGTGSNTGVNLQSVVSGVLPVANGGTGSSTATFSGANITSLNASSVSSGTLAVARGGTGAGDASGARSNLGLGSLATLSSVGTSQIDAAAVTPAKLSQPFTTGSSVATTSGTSIDITGIPSWARQVTVIISGVSINGTSGVFLRIGDSGGIETTGYETAYTWLGNGTTSRQTGSWGLFNFVNNDFETSGVLMLHNISGNTWVGFGNTSSNNSLGGTQTFVIAGTKTLSGTLDRIRIFTDNGTDTFDAGLLNIMYQ